LLKIVLVSLNYQIGVHINFAQSRIPVLVCSLPLEYGCHKTRRRIAMADKGAMPLPIPMFLD